MFNTSDIRTMAGMGQKTGQSYGIAVSTITPCTFDYQDLGTKFLTSGPRTASQDPKAYGSFRRFQQNSRCGTTQRSRPPRAAGELIPHVGCYSRGSSCPHKSRPRMPLYLVYDRRLPLLPMLHATCTGSALGSRSRELGSIRSLWHS